MKQYTVSEYLRILEKLKTIKMPGFKPYDFWRLIYVTVYRYLIMPNRSEDNEIGSKRAYILKSLLKETERLMFIRCIFSDLGNIENKTILYLSSHYGNRNDMQQTMHTVAGCSDELTLIQTERVRRIAPNPRYLFLVLRWFRVIDRLDVTTELKCILLQQTVNAYLFLQCLQKNDQSLLKANAVLSLNDENCDENLLVQLFQKHGLPTATLQHGHMWNTKDSEDLIGYAHNFKELTADYFFAWGQYTCDMAVKDGVSPERMIPVGVPKYIGKTEKLPLRHEKVFGVFFDTPVTGSKTNVDLAGFANLLSETYGYSFYVKLHPYDSAERYDSLFNAHFLGYAKSGSVMEFSETIDFSIVCKSSVLFEQIFFNKPVFRYLPPAEIDLFEGLSFSAFSDEAQLREIMELYLHDEEAYMRKMLDLSDYCCGKGDLADNYRNAVHWLNSQVKTRKKEHV